MPPTLSECVHKAHRPSRFDVYFITLCCEIYLPFRVPKFVTITTILVTCKLPLRVSQRTVATFFWCGYCGGQRYFQFFSGFHAPKIIKIGSLLTELLTRSSAIAEGPRDASCQLKSCQLPRNSAETTYTTSSDQIDGMKLEV